MQDDAHLSSNAKHHGCDYCVDGMMDMTGSSMERLDWSDSGRTPQLQSSQGRYDNQGLDLQLM